MRIPACLLALLLSFPACALAGPTFDISCDNVHDISVSGHGQDAFFDVQLTMEGSKALYEATKNHIGERMTITAQGKVLERWPIQEPFASGLLSIEAETRAQAIRQAERICPTKVDTAEQTDQELMRNALQQKTFMEHPERLSAPHFPISCAMIDSMGLWRMTDFIWRDGTGDGCNYVLFVYMTDDGARALTQALEQAGPTYYMLGDMVSYKNYVQFASGDRTVVTDSPNWDTFNTSAPNALLVFRTLERALKAAQVICPAKAPHGVTHDDL